MFNMFFRFKLSSTHLTFGLNMFHNFFAFHIMISIKKITKKTERNKNRDTQGYEDLLPYASFYKGILF